MTVNIYDVMRRMGIGASRLATKRIGRRLVLYTYETRCLKLSNAFPASRYVKLLLVGDARSGRRITTRRYERTLAPNRSVGDVTTDSRDARSPFTIKHSHYALCVYILKYTVALTTNSILALFITIAYTRNLLLAHIIFLLSLL